MAKKSFILLANFIPYGYKKGEHAKIMLDGKETVVDGWIQENGKTRENHLYHILHNNKIRTLTHQELQDRSVIDAIDGVVPDFINNGDEIVIDGKTRKIHSYYHKAISNNEGTLAHMKPTLMLHIQSEYQENMVATEEYDPRRMKAPQLVS